MNYLLCGDTGVKLYVLDERALRFLWGVQRLPNGNTLVVFSNAGRIEEVSPSWEVVQSLTTDSFAYANWRETLYGPPAR